MVAQPHELRSALQGLLNLALTRGRVASSPCGLSPATSCLPRRQSVLGRPVRRCERGGGRALAGMWLGQRFRPAHTARPTRAAQPRNAKGQVHTSDRKQTIALFIPGKPTPKTYPVSEAPGTTLRRLSSPWPRVRNHRGDRRTVPPSPSGSTCAPGRSSNALYAVPTALRCDAITRRG
jgi:hypothetical protein